MIDASELDKRTVILVEDEPAVRRSLQLLLQGCGYDTKSYGSRGALLADPDAVHADGMVADYLLPDGDGVRLLEQLKDRGFVGGAVLMTAFGAPEITARAEQAGFARVLDKPLSDRILLAALRQAMG